MTEETDAPQGGAEAIVVHETLDAAPAVETTNADDTAAQPETGADNPDAADDAGAEPTKPKQVPWFQKRIDELTAKRYEAEREAAYWRGKADTAPVHQEQAQAVPDRWDDPEGYDRYLIEQAKKEVRTELQRDKTTSTYHERVAKVREAKPDFDSVTTNPALPITPVMANVIYESELGPEVAYHLGANPGEAARIAALPEYRQAAELGKLEVKLSQPAPAPVTRTPPPPPPETVAGLSAGIAKSPEDMSMAEYIAARNAGQI
jgi:hypothetical protein